VVCDRSGAPRRTWMAMRRGRESRRRKKEREKERDINRRGRKRKRHVGKAEEKGWRYI